MKVISFHLSSLRSFQRTTLQTKGVCLRFALQNEPDYCLGSRPTLEDYLVLTAIALELAKYDITSENSFLKRSLKDFYSDLVSVGRVERLIKLDLTRSINTIKKDTVIKKLESLVRYLLKLISDFLSLPLPFLMDEVGEGRNLCLPTIPFRRGNS